MLDVGCGPGRHAYELARRGLLVHGVDISTRFVELARAGAPDGATFERLDARELPFIGEFDAAVCLCQGAFGLMTADGGDGSVIAGIARALRPGGRLALSAFNAYFAVKYHTEATFDADLGVAHERMEVRDHDGRPADFDGWTGCYTPRELRLLLTAHGFAVERDLERRAGRVRRRSANDRVAGVPRGRPDAVQMRPDGGSIAIDQGPLLPSYPASGAYPVSGRRQAS